MYPRVIINKNYINDNIKVAKELCKKNNISLCLVSKVLSGNMEILNSLDLTNVDAIADSRLENLAKMNNISKEKWLIRIPSFCEVEDTIKYADVSLNSSLETIKLLNEEAIKQNKKHKVILMYELGDLREGVEYSTLSMIVNETKNLSNIILYGIGSNLTCYGGVAPSEENTLELFKVADALEFENKLKFDVISGSNSSSYKLLDMGLLKGKMNYARFGESIFLGNIPGYDEKINDMHQDTFIIEAQISELEYKESIPRGEILKNSFGEVPVFIDNGERKHALINIGKQDVSVNLKPLDEDILVLDGSSDYLILDVTNSKKDYQLGDVLSFVPDYESLLKCMTSSYIRKEIK